jgi:hypothetical protein
MIVVEAGWVEALLVEQELDDQRCTAWIGFEGFADLVLDGFRHRRMRNVVPDAWAAKQVCRPRPTGLGHFLLFDFAGMDDCRGFHSTREKECDCQKRQSEPATASSIGPPRRSRDSIHASPKGKRSEPCIDARRIVGSCVTILVGLYRIAVRERLSGLCLSS